MGTVLRFPTRKVNVNVDRWENLKQYIINSLKNTEIEDEYTKGYFVGQNDILMRMEYSEQY